MYKIDKTDCEIVDLLIQDGRMPASQIARRIGGISERAVRYRIEQMVKDEIIIISAVPNPSALGYTVLADVFIEVETHAIMQVAQDLTEQECVRYVSCSIGEQDISAQIVARSNAEIYAFATEVIGKMPGVRKTITSIVPITLKDVHQWRIPSEARPSEE